MPNCFDSIVKIFLFENVKKIAIIFLKTVYLVLENNVYRYIPI